MLVSSETSTPEFTFATDSGGGLIEYGSPTISTLLPEETRSSMSLLLKRLRQKEAAAKAFERRLSGEFDDLLLERNLAYA